jgi:hypothetical protein
MLCKIIDNLRHAPVLLKDTIFTPGFSWVFFQDVLNNSKLIVFGLPIRITADLNRAANSH